ncbi:hypothetical protein [Staphylococcus xylosus]
MFIKKALSAVLAVTLLFGFSGEAFVHAEDTNTTQQVNQSEIDKNAHILEVMYDQAAVYNEETDMLEFKESVLKQNLDSTEYNEIIGDLRQNNQLAEEQNTAFRAGVHHVNWRAKLNGKKGEKVGAYVDKCVANEASNTYGPKAAKAITKLILAEDYKKAAKEIAKRGLKVSGNVVTLSQILATCLSQAQAKYK